MTPTRGEEVVSLRYLTRNLLAWFWFWYGIGGLFDIMNVQVGRYIGAGSL